MAERRCRVCGASLSRYHGEGLCWPCQEKLNGWITIDRPYYDLDDLQRILGLDSAESVKRLGRMGMIPGRIPGVKAHRYLKETVDEWVRSGGEVSDHGSRAITCHTVAVPPETQESTLPDSPATCYHTLGIVPQNVVVTVTDKGIPGPPPVVGEVTASSYMLASLVASGQVVKHTAIPPAP